MTMMMIYVCYAQLQVMRGVEFLHSHNVYHRDIKMENVLLRLNPSEGKVVAKLCDLGAGTDLQRSTSGDVGTSGYNDPTTVTETGYNPEKFDIFQ